MARPVVAIVGRTNVGKSTLFNRVVGRRQAVVDDVPGVTRDRNTAVAEWAGREFFLVDTGGLLPEARQGMDQRVREQVEAAVDTAELVLVVVDVTAGRLAVDEEIAALVRRRARPALLVANKADSPSRATGAHEFVGLGLGEPVAVSALHGDGVGDLLDACLAKFPPAGDEPIVDPTVLKIAVVGRPNVGKSSIVNRLLGEERMIVSDVPGTTRDSVDTEFIWHGRRFVLIDTAGLRRRTHIDTRTEFYCAVRAIRAVERADVAIQVLDTSVPFSRQDYRISGIIFDTARPAVLAFNKWDLVDKETLTAKRQEDAYRAHVRGLWYAPAVFVSALSGQRLSRLPQIALDLHEAARQRYARQALEEVLEDAVTYQSPPALKRGRLRFRRVEQVSIDPIRLVIETSNAKAVPETYRRYLLRRFREGLGIRRAPLRLEFREPRGRRAAGGKR